MYPSRIICLTEETTETLYLLGEGDRVVGVSGYTVRPPEARKKPRVSAFINANFNKIEALRPDLIFAFSDLQAESPPSGPSGLSVFTFNQRSVDEILQTILVVGGIVGRAERAQALVDQLRLGHQDDSRGVGGRPRRPRVHVEEWDDPLITGIRWVDDLVEIAGGAPSSRSRRVPRERPHRRSGGGVRRDPEVVLASWCGKAVKRARITGRPGWDAIGRRAPR